MMTKLQLMGDDGSYNDVTIKNEFRAPEYEYYVIESATPLLASDGESVSIAVYLISK